MDDIVDSLELVPTGYTVVPPCQRLMLRSAIEQLDDAELGVKLIQASTLSDRETEPPVTRQTIASGAIVEKGTVVGLGFPSMN
jgi:beta-lactam-binding protein with PASTA domain